VRGDPLLLCVCVCVCGGWTTQGTIVDVNDSARVAVSLALRGGFKSGAHVEYDDAVKGLPASTAAAARTAGVAA